MDASHKIIENINAASERRATHELFVIEQQKIRRAYAPILWSEFKAALLAGRDNIRNATPMTLEVKQNGPYRISVVNRENGKRISFEFNPQAPCLNFDRCGDHGIYGFRVVDVEGMAVMIGDSSGVLPISELVENCFMELTQ